MLVFLLQGKSTKDIILNTLTFSKGIFYLKFIIINLFFQNNIPNKNVKSLFLSKINLIKIVIGLFFFLFFFLHKNANFSRQQVT